MTVNPYQGLKLGMSAGFCKNSIPEMTVNPYQGLKLNSLIALTTLLSPEMTVNPYQGLKQWRSLLPKNLTPHPNDNASLGLDHNPLDGKDDSAKFAVLPTNHHVSRQTFQ